MRGSRWDVVRSVFFVALGVINISLFIALIYRWYLSDTIDAPPMTRSDYLDLSLTLLELILSVLTVLLAIGAFVAYYDIRRAAERMADRTAREVVQGLSGDGSSRPNQPLPTGQRERPDPTAMGTDVTTEHEEGV